MLRWLKRGLGLILALLGVFFLGSNLWVWSAAWGRMASEPDQVPVGAVMVLLGTDEFNAASGRRSATFDQRIDAAVALACSGRVKLVVASGTDVHARAMAAKLRAGGVTCPIVEDPYGWRTLDSVLRAKASYPREHIVFVSQGWHCARALWLADREALRSSAYPAAFGAGWRPVMSAVRDCFAKPKALLDRYVLGNPLSAPAPAHEGNVPHR
jgi:SanA protein